MRPITFGSDPEFMIKDQFGNLKSAIGIVNGTKEAKLDLGDGSACYYDNILGECNIKPSSSAEEAVEHVKDCLTKFSECIKPYILVPQASAFFPKQECLHPDALLFGCDPEFCAYDVEVVNPPVCQDTFRSCGGHVHIGYDGGVDIEQGDLSENDWEERLFKISWDRIWVVRMCDLFLGIPSIFIDKDPSSKDRRRLYGGAGTHRVCQAYGIEYRSLSNFWLARPSTVSLIYELANFTAKLVTEDQIHEDIWENKIDSSELRRTINTADIDSAAGFMNFIRTIVPKQLFNKIEIESSKGYSDSLIEWGIKS